MNATCTALSHAALSPPHRSRPLYLSPVVAGFPSPADDHIDGGIDLNQLLIKNPPATFFVRVDGDSMINAGIVAGDVLIIDRSKRPRHRNIVIAAVDGEFTVKRFMRRGKTIELQAEHPDYPTITVTETQELEIIGVVSGVIRDDP